MTGTIKTAKEIKRAITLREAGYSVAAISNKTGISPSTLTRHFKKLGASKGSLTAKAIDSAKDELLNDAGFIGDLKHQIASSIVDDLAQSRSIREATALALEQLINDDSELASVKARSLSALATATKITQEVQRKALDVDGYNSSRDLDDLPELVITGILSFLTLQRGNTACDAPASRNAGAF